MAFTSGSAMGPSPPRTLSCFVGRAEGFGDARVRDDVVRVIKAAACLDQRGHDERAVAQGRGVEHECTHVHRARDIKRWREHGHARTGAIEHEDRVARSHSESLDRPELARAGARAPHDAEQSSAAVEHRDLARLREGSNQKPPLSID